MKKDCKKKKKKENTHAYKQVKARKSTSDNAQEPKNHYYKAKQRRR